WGLTTSHQVLCITHLPQIAAFADSHFKITKEVVGDRTRTQVDELDPATQEQEIAAMIGGTPISPVSLENAREILKETANRKQRKQIRVASSPSPLVGERGMSVAGGG